MYMYIHVHVHVYDLMCCMVVFPTLCYLVCTHVYINVYNILCDIILFLMCIQFLCIYTFTMCIHCHAYTHDVYMHLYSQGLW